MAKPVYLGAVGKADLGGNGGAQVKVRVTAKATNRQNGNAIRQVNQNLTRNPNHSPKANHGNGNGHNNKTVGNGNGNGNNGNNDLKAHGNQNGGNNRQINNNNVAQNANVGNNGTNHAAPQGLEHGQGHQKVHHQNGQNQTNGNNFPPNNNGQHNRTNGNHGNHQNQTNNQGNQINHKNTPQVYDPHGNNDLPRFQTHQNNNSNRAHNGFNQNNTGPIRQIIAQVLGQNDVYINTTRLGNLVNNQTFPANTQTLPNQVQNGVQTTLLPNRDINNLIQNIGNRVLSLLNNSPHLTDRAIRQIAVEVSRQFHTQIETAKTQILKNADLGAKTFNNLNIAERMNTAIELLPAHLPPKTAENLSNYQPKEILAGMLLARGLIVGQENTATLRNLISFQQQILPDKISLTELRDVGQIVKILIADTAFAKTTANLDQAVQKFIKILLANNELGVMLASVNLAAQTRYSGGLVSRSLALAQIYELITRLIIAGEKAMKEVAAEKFAVLSSPKSGKSELSAIGAAIPADKDEQIFQTSKTQISNAESALRQFLEFNPAFAFDNSASAFNNSEDAHQAQRDFVSVYRDDIDAWLQSGNHRFVKDIDLEKPVGVVVERNSDGIFTSSKVRIVLVRDSSVIGWHFLKSFLVK